MHRWLRPSLAQGPRVPVSEARGPGAVVVYVEKVSLAFYQKPLIKPDSQGQQDALATHRQGIAGHLLPPIGGEANNNPNPVRINWKGPPE